MSDTQHFIEKCKTQIESKLGWGTSANWQAQDFENLSDTIFKATDVVLSASTLKRIWGKVQYNSKPNLSTLDTLARFIGYENWRTFTASEQPTLTISHPTEKPKRASRKFFIPVILVIAALVFAGFIFTKKNSKSLRFNDIRFSSRPVTIGVPNTVIFEYDASNSNADSVFIQQSWDPRRRFKVDKNLKTYTSTYYMPGYYRAKLILNDSIVKEHDVFIESNGWMGVINQEVEPLYLGKNIAKPNGQIGITETDLKDLKIDTNKKAPKFVLTNVSKEFNVNTNNLLLNLEIQNTYTNSNAICRKTNIILLGTDGIIFIPLSKIGCVGELDVVIGKKDISGATHDLSGFGVDFSKPVSVQCQSMNGKIKMVINGKIALEDSFDGSIGKIVGARITFEGTGLINSFELKPAL